MPNMFNDFFMFFLFGLSELFAFYILWNRIRSSGVSYLPRLCFCFVEVYSAVSLVALYQELDGVVDTN